MIASGFGSDRNDWSYFLNTALRPAASFLTDEDSISSASRLRTARKWLLNRSGLSRYKMILSGFPFKILLQTAHSHINSGCLCRIRSVCESERTRELQGYNSVQALLHHPAL